VSRLFDEQFPELAEKREITKKKIAEKLAEERAVFDQCFGTDVGVRALRMIMKKCGYQQSSVTFNEKGEMLKDKMAFIEANRSLYIYIRKNIHPDILQKVEIQT